MPTLRMMRMGAVSIDLHPDLVKLSDAQIGQLCESVQDTTAWVICSPVVVVSYEQTFMLIANPFSYWLMNRNCNVEYPVLELSAAEATEKVISYIQHVDQVMMTRGLQPANTENKPSRPTRAKHKRIGSGQVCLLCEIGHQGRENRSVPLKVPKAWSALLKNRSAGALLCPRCGFKILITAQQLTQFAKGQLPTSALIRIKYDRDGEPERCDHCVSKNQGGIKLERLQCDTVVTECCSNLLKTNPTCSFHSIWVNNEVVSII